MRHFARRMNDAPASRAALASASIHSPNARNLRLAPGGTYRGLSMRANERVRRSWIAHGVNTPGGDAFAPMLDWSRSHRLTFTTRRPVDSPDGADLRHRVRLEKTGTALPNRPASASGKVQQN
jgi:hypothetical protein